MVWVSEISYEIFQYIFDVEISYEAKHYLQILYENLVAKIDTIYHC